MCRNLLLEGCNLGTNAIVIAAQVIAQGEISDCVFGRLVRNSPATALVAISVR
jgi:hypothetical protein